MTRLLIRHLRLSLNVTCWCLVYTLLVGACRPRIDSQPIPPTGTIWINGYNYPTRLIGSQRWTTVNYQGPGGIPYAGASEMPIYGRYYTYTEAKALALPAGWRLPTQADWTTLVQREGIILEQNTAKGQEAVKRLLSITNWRRLPGTNASGFDAQPAGYSINDQPPADGDIAEFWTAEGSSISIQEGSHNNHLLRFYGNENDPTVRYTLRLVSDK